MNRFEKLKEELKEQNFLRRQSPLEKWVIKFLPVCGIYDYILEYQIDYYFIDIAFPHLKYGVELDGKEFHQNSERDKKRDNYLKERGWEIKRISSTECWNPRILAHHLLEIFNKTTNNRIITWGLAELLKVENEIISRIDKCQKCKEYHDLNIPCPYSDDYGEEEEEY